MTNRLTARDIAQIAIVAAIYVVLAVMPPLNAISYGFAQFRLSEMLNFLPFYNKKYILSVTIGCMVTNALGPNGLIDVVIGGGSTLIFVSLGVLLFKRSQKIYVFNGLFNKAFLYFSFFFATSMITIAFELVYIGAAPKISFFLLWFMLFIGELLSLLVGAILIDRLSKRIDFTQ